MRVLSFPWRRCSMKTSIQMAFLMAILFFVWSSRVLFGSSGNVRALTRVCAIATDMATGVLSRSAQGPDRLADLEGGLGAVMDEEEDALQPSKSRPSVVHVTWCGTRVFKFQNYLSVLSVVRVIKPLRILFHAETLPATDKFLYDTWFEESLKQFFFLEKRQLPSGTCSNATSLLQAVTSYLSGDEGKGSTPGAYVADAALVTRFEPFVEATSEVTWYGHGSNVSSGLPDVIITHTPLRKGRQLDDVFRSVPRRPCLEVTRKNFAEKDLLAPHLDCLLLQDDFFPEDFIELDTPLGQYIRWLFYGHSDVRTAQPASSRVVPNVAHFIWLQQEELDFSHFLSILSALHVARFSRVFVHSDVQPKGRYWSMLAHPNLTLLRIQQPDEVFQQKVTYLAHKSDLIRLQILLQYGGVYTDRDAFWVKPPDDRLLSYDCVISYDWPNDLGGARTVNIGVLVARRGARFLQLLLETMHDYRDWSWYFNSILMPFRVYEKFPDTVRLDTHLQVICYIGICHPTWEKSYRRPLGSKEKTLAFDWRTEVYTVHVTSPKPPLSFKSPEALKNATDIMAEIGRFILEKAGMTEKILGRKLP